jgi:F-type H+-transporting ATPase subunit delta
MASNQLARPYAAAIFELASSSGNREEWSNTLAVLAHITANERVARVLRAPRLSPEERADLVLGIAEGHVEEGARNLVRLMAINGRLPVLPDVAHRYEALRAEAEGIVDASITSAAELDKDQRERVSASLKKRLDREIRLHCEVDPSLIGGAVIRAGDLVIDGSLKGRLERLTSRLAH